MGLQLKLYENHRDAIKRVRLGYPTYWKGYRESFIPKRDLPFRFKPYWDTYCGREKHWKLVIFRCKRT